MRGMVDGDTIQGRVPNKLWRIVYHGVVVLLTAGCAPPPPAPLPPNTFAFGVFGDAPYRSWEMGRVKRLIADANNANLQWLLYVGDLLWYPCSDAALADRLGLINTVRPPVIYTPGDNEWTDCHEDIAGRFQPLDRLAYIRRTFFAQPRQSLGGSRMAVESQSDNAAWSEFVENARWRFGGFLFATIHMVGSSNALDRYPGRTAAEDDEVTRRTAAALAWLDSSFALALSDSLHGVIVAMHGDPGFENPVGARPGFSRFLDRLSYHVSSFSGPVLLIHGDGHTYRVDQPLKRHGTGDALRNFSRLETFGSPDIGWVRVVIDSVAGRVVDFEPRMMPRRLLW